MVCGVEELLLIAITFYNFARVVIQSPLSEKLVNSTAVLSIDLVMDFQTGFSPISF